jgi:hypothetical protein
MAEPAFLSTYLLLCVGGLEEVAADHVREHFAAAAADATADATEATGSSDRRPKVAGSGLVGPDTPLAAWSVLVLSLVTSPIALRPGLAGVGQLLLKSVGSTSTHASYNFS